MKKAHQIGLRYLAEDLLALPEPPSDVALLLDWVREFRDLRERARTMFFQRRQPSYGAGIAASGGGRMEFAIGSSDYSFKWKRCEHCYKSSDLTVHHCVPKAVGGRDKDCVTLCRQCHNMAHSFWGPGDNYKGPEDPRETLRELRRLARQEAAK